MRFNCKWFVSRTINLPVIFLSGVWMGQIELLEFSSVINCPVAKVSLEQICQAVN